MFFPIYFLFIIIAQCDALIALSSPSLRSHLPREPLPSQSLFCARPEVPGPESGGNFVTEEQLEVARNGAVHQASSRGKADRFVISSVTKLPTDSWPDLN